MIHPDVASLLLLLLWGRRKQMCPLPFPRMYSSANDLRQGDSNMCAMARATIRCSLRA
jgi:hypothetical protein